MSASGETKMLSFNIFLKSHATHLFVQQLVQANNKEALVYQPLLGDSISDQWIPLTKDQYCGKLFHVMISFIAII